MKDLEQRARVLQRAVEAGQCSEEAARQEIVMLALSEENGPKKSMKNVVLQHKDAFVKGYSTKHKRVYFTHDPKLAKRFADVEAQDFIRDHANKSDSFRTQHITLHIIKRGMPFNPLGVDHEKAA